MPPITVIFAATAVGASIPLLWWSVAGARTDPRSASRGLLAAGSAPPDLRASLLQRSAADRTVKPGLQRLAAIGRRLTPGGRLDALDRLLTRAGRPASWPLDRILAAKVVLGVAGAFGGFALVPDELTPPWLLVWAGTTVVSFFLPDLLLHSRGEKRQDAIALELPDTLDQMTIAVEAGLGFESAMARAAKTGMGELAVELQRTLQEVQVGVPRSKALRGLAERTDVPDLRHFVLAVIQAEGYGIPIAEVLRTQAIEQRTKRRQRAEEKAMKIPVKVLFPLVLCIFPTLFIIILGPAAIKLARML